MNPQFEERSYHVWNQGRRELRSFYGKTQKTWGVPQDAWRDLRKQYNQLTLTNNLLSQALQTHSPQVFDSGT